jgi:pimeloyl-ACP methyl ester carboxylesterase
MLKGLFKTALVVGGIAAAVYAAEKLMLKQLESNPEPDHPWQPHTPNGTLVPVTTADGTKLRVMTEGEGQPIVLVHGLLVSLEAFASVWDPLVQAGHQVVGMDLRGHGGSTVGENGHSLEEAGDDIAAVLKQLDLHDAVLVGHSMGGMAVLSFAVDHLDDLTTRVAGLVISNSAGGGLFDPPQNKVQLGAVKAGLGNALVSHAVHGKVLSRLYFGPRPSYSMVAALNELHAAQTPETMVEASTALERYELHHALDNIHAPTLVVGSDKDGILPPTYSKRIAEAIPGARLEIFEGIGHMTHWEAPQAFVDMVLGFAAEVVRLAD